MYKTSKEIPADEMELIERDMSQSSGEKFSQRLNILAELHPGTHKNVLKALLMTKEKQEKKQKAFDEQTRLAIDKAQLDGGKITNAFVIETTEPIVKVKKEEPAPVEADPLADLDAAIKSIHSALDNLCSAKEHSPLPLKQLPTLEGMMKNMMADLVTFRAGAEWYAKGGKA